MRAFKGMVFAIALVVGMIVLPAPNAGAQRYCPPPPPSSGSVTQGALQASGVTSANAQYTVPQYLEWVIQDADRMWSSWFTGNGMCEPEVGYQLIGVTAQSFTSKCRNADGSTLTVVHNYPNAFYCELDVTVGANGHQYVGTVILPVTTFHKMWFGDIFGTNSGMLGDFAAGAIVAHEFGHHVEDELSKQLGWQHPAGKKKELIADCFAGVWAWSVNQRGQLERGDLNEIVAALNTMGDATIYDNDHGTAQERINAFSIGWQSGTPMNCINSYWR